MYYQIKEKLTPCSADEVFNPKPGDPPYVVVMDPKTWYWTKEQFDMVIDIEMDPLAPAGQLRRTSDPRYRLLDPRSVRNPRPRRCYLPDPRRYHGR